MYYTLWRNDEDIPNPYTFNTNSLDDIRNFLAWDIVDSITFGKERLKGSSLSTYNLSAIDWNQYGTTLDEVIKTIKTAYSKCTDEVIKNTSLSAQIIITNQFIRANYFIISTLLINIH